MLRRALGTALLAAMLTACAGLKLDNKDYAAMNTIPLRTVCVGRMLVDLPRGNPLEWQQQFDYAKVSKLPYAVNTADAFRAYVGKRKAELEQPTAVHSEGSLGAYKEIGDNAVILQFRDQEVAIQGYYTERYLWLGHWGYKYETGGLFDKDALALLPKIEKTLDQLKPISKAHPPSKPGFCIDSALVIGNIGPIGASAAVAVPQWKGVRVGVGTREDDGSRALLPWQTPRHRHPLPSAFDDLDAKQAGARKSMRTSDEARAVSFDILRRRERRLAGISGMETAYKMKLANGQEYYDFNWESTGAETRPNKTAFGAYLRAGRNQYTSDYMAPPPGKDLLALWDAMLESLRPRPDAH